ncbi:hypothetical protein ACFVYA_31890 [Amycolatopsis sp. NPDC058278]|uniref:hypothetical protein n=1 Tax=Amycolatopsis sp. NPDC058278 TaxID=3346417 RepID=UPI0036DB14DB
MGAAPHSLTGENTSTGEQVCFGLSQGNDPTRWRQLNGGKPVLTSTVGTREELTVSSTVATTAMVHAVRRSVRLATG